QHDNLLACVQHLFDSDNCLSFDSASERAKTETWLAWEYFHLGKMQGQAMEFYRQKSPFEAVPMKDPVKETESLYRILDGALGEERSYLAGSGAGKFSVADIAVFGWVNVAYHSGINLERFPSIQTWWKRILERPAIQHALERTKIRAKYNTRFLEAMERTPQFREQEESLREGMREA
ncbi:glutathione S-transferase, partial [Phyllosticta citrichinensis]